MRMKKATLIVLSGLVLAGIVAPWVTYKVACYWAFLKVKEEVVHDLEAARIDPYCSSRSTRDSILKENKGFLTSSPKRSLWNTFVKRDPGEYQRNNYGIYSAVSRWYAFKAQEKEDRWRIGHWHLFIALISVSFETRLSKEDMIQLGCFCDRENQTLIRTRSIQRTEYR
jgi:hypothetical protein